jgi:hypothetical protein
MVKYLQKLQKMCDDYMLRIGTDERTHQNTIKTSAGED